MTPTGGISQWKNGPWPQALTAVWLTGLRLERKGQEGKLVWMRGNRLHTGWGKEAQNYLQWLMCEHAQSLFLKGDTILKENQANLISRIHDPILKKF